MSMDYLTNDYRKDLEEDKYFIIWIIFEDQTLFSHEKAKFSTNLFFYEVEYLKEIKNNEESVNSKLNL